MERKLQSRVLLVSAVALVAIAIVLTVVVPGATRVSMIVDHGVKTADKIRLGFYVAGALLAVVGALLGFRGYQLIQLDKRQAEARRELERPIGLLSATETDLNKIIPELKRIAVLYPQVADEISQTLADQRSLQDSLMAVREIFKANTGVVTDGDTEYSFASYELLIQRAIDATCRALVGITYQAKATQEFSISRLESSIDQVNQNNAERIKMANELAFKAAESVPKVGKESDINTHVLKQMKQLLVQLSKTETVFRKEAL